MTSKPHASYLCTILHMTFAMDAAYFVEFSEC